MKKLIIAICFFSLLFYVFSIQRIVTQRSGEIDSTIKDSIRYFYDKISSFLLIPHEDAVIMFQWGYKKLKGQPISRSESIRARYAFFRTGVPAALILAILGRVLYGRIKRPKYLLRDDVSTLSDVPVPDTCPGG